MNNQKIVIVGGVAGGATAAARLRRINEHAHIILIERGENISFANCGLPYYIGGTIEKRGKLLVQTVEKMKEKLKLDIRNKSEVRQINRKEKSVRVLNLRTGEEYEETYDTLLLSPGAKPFVPPIPGVAEAKNLFTLRNIPDTDKIKNYVDKMNPKKAVVVGAGFIGLEMAENLHQLGIEVSLIELSSQVMVALDFEMAAMVQQHLRSKGVDLYLNDGLKTIEDSGRKLILESGAELDADIIIMSVGVQPESTLAEDAGLDLGYRKGIRVNSYLQTSDPDIYAVGDAIEVKDYISGEPCFAPLAWPANHSRQFKNAKYCW